MNIPLILASSSSSRLKLLEQINIIPDFVVSPDINEIPMKNELPRELVSRLALEKCMIVSEKFESGIVLSADTIGCIGRRVLEKSISRDDIINSMNILSGRRHRVYTSIFITRKESGKIISKRTKTVCSIVKLKRLTKKEIEVYADLGHGINTATGYRIEMGYVEKFISFVSGSISNIKGLPLFELSNLLSSVGYI